MTDTTASISTGRSLLRPALVLDAAVTGLNGVAYLAAAGPLEDLLGLPAAWLRTAGTALVGFAILVALASRRPGAGAVRAIVAVNAAWAVGSVVFAIAGWGSPETAGTVWIVLQALVVAGFAELQVASAPWRAGRTS
jgi:hypothetical protein